MYYAYSCVVVPRLSIGSFSKFIKARNAIIHARIMFLYKRVRKTCIYFIPFELNKLKRSSLIVENNLSNNISPASDFNYYTNIFYL